MPQPVARQRSQTTKLLHGKTHLRATTERLLYRAEPMRFESVLEELYFFVARRLMDVFMAFSGYLH